MLYEEAISTTQLYILRLYRPLSSICPSNQKQIQGPSCHMFAVFWPCGLDLGFVHGPWGKLHDCMKVVYGIYIVYSL